MLQFRATTTKRAQRVWSHTEDNAVTIKVHMIDGVAVTKRVFEARKLYGEYPGATYQIIDIRRDLPNKKGAPVRK